MSYDLERTEYGFRWGPLEVARLISDPKFGVIIEVVALGSGDTVEIRVSPKGRRVGVTAGDGSATYDPDVGIGV